MDSKQLLDFVESIRDIFILRLIYMLISCLLEGWDLDLCFLLYRILKEVYSFFLLENIKRKKGINLKNN